MDNSNILIYQTEDGQTKVETLMVDETVWLTQAQMVELFQTSKQNISLHIRNIFSENELQEISVVKDYLITASDGKNYNTKHYNLDVIISVGYRVKSHRGTQFRIWATQKLKEFLVKGFVMDDERLKQPNNSNYFEEITKLDDFIKMSGSEILTHAGKISNKIAEEKAKHEYKEYKAKTMNQLSNAEKDYISYIESKINPIIKKTTHY